MDYKTLEDGMDELGWLVIVLIIVIVIIITTLIIWRFKP